MNDIDLQKAVYAALSADPSLGHTPVVKYYEEADGQYPFVVYKEISNVPALHADNVEIAARVTYQISIVTNDDDYASIESAVKRVMKGLRLIRVDSQELHDDNDYTKVLRYCRAVDAD